MLTVLGGPQPQLPSLPPSCTPSPRGGMGATALCREGTLSPVRGSRGRALLCSAHEAPGHLTSPARDRADTGAGTGHVHAVQVQGEVPPVLTHFSHRAASSVSVQALPCRP